MSPSEIEVVEEIVDEVAGKRLESTEVVASLEEPIRSLQKAVDVERDAGEMNHG